MTRATRLPTQVPLHEAPSDRAERLEHARRHLVRTLRRTHAPPALALAWEASVVDLSGPGPGLALVAESLGNVTWDEGLPPAVADFLLALLARFERKGG